MLIIKYIAIIVMALASGAVIAGGVFGLIATVGVVTRLVQKTRTEKYIFFYEMAIMIGGIFGGTTMYFNYYLPVGSVVVMFLGLCIGVFVGCLAVSLAEVLDVVPILTRRLRLTKGLSVLILAVALGKLCGSIIYYLVPAFAYKI